MILILNAVEVVLSDNTERSCISTKNSSEKLEIVFLFLGLERDSNFRTHYLLELSVGKDNFKGFNVIKT